MTLPCAIASAFRSKMISDLAATPMAPVTAPPSAMPLPGAIFSPIAKRPVVGCDQRGAIRRHEAAQDRPAGLHELRRHHHVDVAGRRHQRQDRLAAVERRHRLDIVDRGAGALGDAGHRGRLRDPAMVLGQLNDPVGQHAATLATHRDDRDGDRPLGCLAGGGEGQPDRLVSHANASSAGRRRSRRRCNQPITAIATLDLNLSQPVGL